jgi:hypothetical protein
MRGRPVRLSLALALACGVCASTPSAGASGGGEPTERLRREVESLRSERALASGKGFYLRLDAPQRRLALMLRGVALDDYALGRLEWGVPEVLFLDRRPPADWDLAGVSKGRLEPERARDRLEVVAHAPAPEEAPPPPPKSAEETVSVPATYRVVFEGGISLEVRTRGAGGRNRSILRRALDAVRLRWRDLGAAFGVGTTERVRLRVELTPDDAASLYRSLPPEIALIVVGLPPS